MQKNINAGPSQDGPKRAKYEFKTQPWKHQREALIASWDKEYFALLCDYGTGKTKIIIDTAGILYEQNMLSALFIIAPNEVHERWLSEQIPQHLPDRIKHIKIAWTGATTKKFKESLECFWQKKYETYLKIFSINIEALQSSKRAKNFSKNFLSSFPTLLAVDECFSFDTEIDTPNGPRKIGTIESGDRVYNAYGIDQVIAVKRTKVNKGIKINGVCCSENHPWFTRDGWKRARDIRPGDYLVETASAMRLLRNCFLPEESQRQISEVLRKELFCEMEDEPGGVQENTLYKGKRRKNIAKSKEVVSLWFRERRKSKRTYKKFKTHAKPGIFGKNEKSKKRPKNCCERRQWQRANGSAKNIIRCLIRRMGNGTCNSFRKAQGWISNKLQNRYSSSDIKNSDRSGWLFPYVEKSDCSRQEKGKKIEFVRVESVEILESGNPDLEKYRNEDGFIYFYDLKIKRHPSFSVNYCLVHNSTRIKHPSRKRTQFIINHLSELAKYRRTLTGNEVTRSPFDVYSPYRFLKRSFWLPSLPDYHTFKHRYGKWKTNFTYRKSAKLKKDHTCPHCLAAIQEIKIEMGFGICPACRGVIREGLPEKVQKLIDNNGKFEFPKIIGYHNLEELRKKTQAHSYLIRKEECMDLPPKIYQPLYTELNDEQRRIYKELKKQLATEYQGSELSVPNKIALTMRFQQIVGGFFPETGAPIGDTNPKLERLLYDLEDIDTADPIIIWSRFTAELQAIAAELRKNYDKKVALYYGDTPKPERKKIITDFQDGKYGFFVANQQTAGTGLNLQRAYIHYYYSNSFNSEDRWQSEDRSHRGGQKNTCLYKDIFIKNTVDDTIKEANDNKKKLADFFMTRKLEEVV